MGLSLPHLIVVALVVLILFGRGRISDVMGDFGKGIKSFKQGMNEEASPPPQAKPALPDPQADVNGQSSVGTGSKAE
jgi:sec-independent protein translocase protein TatA